MLSLIPELNSAIPGSATISTVIDHVEHAASIVGYDHLGIGFDFDGMPTTIQGLEDVSKFPNLVAEMLKRDIRSHNIEMITGMNFIRVFKKVEEESHRLNKTKKARILQDTVKPLWSPGLMDWCRKTWPNAEH